MKYNEFDQLVPDPKMEICQAAYLENRDKIQVKKEKIVVKNLERIFDATLEIGILKGFQSMTMRDLSRVSGLSMGGLYSYFSSKEDILSVYLGQGRNIIGRVLDQFLHDKKDPGQKLEVAVQVHLFLSEKMSDWFYFSYMEARHLSPEERERSIQGELYTEKMYEDILVEGCSQGIFREANHTMSAGFIKAMLQDWYLKRGKHARRQVHVDQYATYLIDFIKAFYTKPKEYKS